MDEALERLRRACNVPRPAHFVNADHCSECAEHEATLSGVTPDSISLAELGNPCWDPACFMLPDAFVYFLPGMARLALGTGEKYYLGQFLFHLGPVNLGALESAQRAALAAFLLWLPEKLRSEAAVYRDERELLKVIQALAA